MLKNYIKIAWRNLWKNKVFSGINIAGLSVGMAACVMIMLFVFYEKSFDDFHTKNIYRLNEVQKFPGMVASQKVGLSMYPMGPAIKNEFPEIKNYTRVKWANKYQTTYGDKKIFLKQAFFVDSTFLKMFDFKLISGDRLNALEKPNTVVLTQETAKKLFGDENPIGKTITHYGSDTTSFAVTGILENVPQNSQMQFEGLFSFRSIYKPWMNSWGGNWLDTYFEIDPKANMAALETKFPGFLKKHMQQDGWKYYELFLLPLKDIHANAADIGLDYLNYQKFDKSATNLFAIIAIIVLIIACINFMNLSTARSAERAKEVGIRKSIGAQRAQLSIQFLGETVLLSLIALAFAIIIVLFALPYVNELSQRDISRPLFHNVGFMLSILGGTVFVGVLSGIYPAVFLSSYKPVKVLKGSVETGKTKGNFRNMLVVGQFASAVFLMISTIFVVKQLRFMQKKDPGFTRDQIVTVPLDNSARKHYDVLKQQLLSNNIIAGVTGAQDQLGSHLDQSGVSFRYDNEPKRDLAVTQLITDNNYLKLYNIKIVAGRDFSPEKGAIGREYIVNEELAKELVKDLPHKVPTSALIGKRFGYDSLGTIVGIAKNFNFNSMHYKIETMFISNHPDWGISQMSVKIKGGKTTEAISVIQAAWKNINPDQPFEYQFLDDHFAEVYRADNQVSKIVGILAGLAILISCLGLFGLASYSAEKRVKEIGVRKVLGASVQNIVLLLSGHFVKLVLIANVIAWPIAWYAMNRWLQDYAFHIDISWLTFVLVAFLSILIALVTISFQSVKAAIANPVKSLRSE